jgi:hypothetical protein
MRRVWTENEIAFLRENYGKIPHEVIARELGRTPYAVRLKAQRLGIYAKRWTPDKEEFLKKHYDMPIEELCRILGETEKSIYMKALKLGLRKQMDNAVWINTNLSNEQLAYLAGIIDGEGCISFTLAKGGRVIRPFIGIANTKRKLIETIRSWLKLRNVARKSRRSAKHKNVWQIHITRYADVKALLEKVKPYLIIKKKQCNLTIKYCTSRLSKGVNSPYSPDEMNIFEKVRKMNKRGVR